MKWWLELAGLAVLGFALLYLALVAMGEWQNAKGAPREDMFWCNRHGAMRRQHCITLLDAPYCPLCFHERLSAAERTK